MYRVQFGLRFALVNSLLHALWQAGLLEADVTNSVPVNVDSALLSARLPPVVRPPLEGEPNDFVIELRHHRRWLQVLGLLLGAILHLLAIYLVLRFARR